MIHKWIHSLEEKYIAFHKIIYEKEMNVLVNDRS